MATNITDTFIRRPVLAMVVSLAILLLGLRSALDLPVLQFPKIESSAVVVNTNYYGADPDIIAGFVTTPIEAAIAQAQGIDYITSASRSGLSTITAVLHLDYDANRALAEISSKINAIIDRLPAESQRPSLSIANLAHSSAAMFLGFSSSSLETYQLSDYLIRVVQPKLQAIPGVQSARVGGGRALALRVWLDPTKLAARNLTAADVSTAIADNNYISAMGAAKGQMITVNLTSGTDLRTVEEFRNLVVKRKGNALVRLNDVATVRLGAENYDSNMRFNGRPSVAILVDTAPSANVLEVAKRIHAIWPTILDQLPGDIEGTINYDATVFVKRSIIEVAKTLVEALVIVTIVIFLFTGTLRSVLIAALAIPLSLVGAFILMLALGYSVNTLTLLALVLAIGLVVDDAIIVVENIDRHMKGGMAPMQAALVGARELTGPIITISIVLIAVYLPIGFQSGLTGKLFTEFAFTLAAAVGISAVVALTLSPMMCSRMFNGSQQEGRLAQWIERRLDSVRSGYERILKIVLNNWPVSVTFGFIVMGLIFVLAKFSQRELAPSEDQGLLYTLTTGPANTSVQQLTRYSERVHRISEQLPEYDRMIQLNGDNLGGAKPNIGFSSIVLKPWDERDRKAPEIAKELQSKFNEIAGAKNAVFSPPALPGGGSGLPFAFVVKTAEPFENLHEVTDNLVKKAQESGIFFYIDSDLKFDKPQARVVIDRDKAALLGLGMRDVGTALGAMLGGGYVNHFNLSGRPYRVIPQVQQVERLNLDQLKNYNLRTANGTMVPASTVVSLRSEVAPETINHFQLLNSSTISGITSMALGDALARMRAIAAEVLPQGYDIDYSGQSRQSIYESNSFVAILGFAVLVIFLVLAIQFESFRDPFIVLASVPMAIFGAMVFIFLGAATLNIYTQVGLVTLIGLIAKHGILIVHYANAERKRDVDKRAAIEIAAATRLRPILMTTAAMVLGAAPLVFSTGAGAVGRNSLGIVITTGILIGTLFTLFIVPAMYLFLSKDVAHQRAKLVELAIPDLSSDLVRSARRS